MTSYTHRCIVLAPNFAVAPRSEARPASGAARAARRGEDDTAGTPADAARRTRARDPTPRPTTADGPVRRVRSFFCLALGGAADATPRSGPPPSPE